MQQSFTLKEIAEMTGGRLIAPSGDAAINRVNSIDSAGSDQITFISDMKYLDNLRKSSAAAVLSPQQLEDVNMAQVVVKDVNAALIAVLEKFAPSFDITPGIHPSAVIDAAANISDTAAVGANTYIGPNVTVEENVFIGPNCSIVADCSIGRGTKIEHNIVMYPHVVIGENCIVQSGTVLGSCGFGYRPVDNIPRLIPHIGGVIIEDYVEIGANCCIDRAKFGNTVIGFGSKLDNLIQIAHNAVIGKCCLITAQCGLAGSSRLGDGVILGGHSGVSDNVSVGSGSMLGAKSAVVSDIGPGSKVMGVPAVDSKRFFRRIVSTERVPELRKQIKQLEKRIQSLEKAANNTK
ncbi:UDP-3-O-acylglucosamine N-acyltransferase [Limihaloglobus sulfuriphilus]|uniref:UDP-3-O-acylglucosamine N-acyltransferase n=1 Tax=Limihaloglobus sulfuriphilus TaxID=1851148 RepID=A0A1Q2MBL3_9BACT|nr:UDP-3-O-(3-hydroxymyristoyl)glucosamine N-acyltransferase [Limihaloglobus sulfuriphilus]AQQ70103.1 UDP-3-O-acylglucosamine N-acyltransferase [Limihaloglobus sulfuriphilus]